MQIVSLIINLCKKLFIDKTQYKSNTSIEEKVNIPIKEPVKETIEKVTKIDDNKVNKLLIKTYTQKILQLLKEELEEDYIKIREKEKILKRYSIEHIEIVKAMGIIVENIKKIKEELDMVTDIHKEIIETIKEDLELKKYKK